METRFCGKGLLGHILVIGLMLAALGWMQGQFDENGSSVKVVYFLYPILLVLIGGYFNLHKLVSWSRSGRLIFRVDYLVVALVLAALLPLVYYLPWGIPFWRVLLGDLVGRPLSFIPPLMEAGRILVPLLFGYFVAGVVYKVGGKR